MSLQCNVQHASEFVAWLGQVPLFTIAFEGGNPAYHEPPGKRLGQWLTKHESSNVYYSCAAFDAKTKKKPTKADLVYCRLLQVDLDADEQHPAGAILAALKAFTPEPSCIVMTGGGYQALWRLRAPVVLRGSEPLDIDVIESRNRWLLSQFKNVASTAGTWNADRLLRFPGSINVLNAKKVAAGRQPTLTELVELNDNVYDLSDFPEQPKDATQQLAKAPSVAHVQQGNEPWFAEHAPIEHLRELDRWNVPNRIRELIALGLSAGKADFDTGVRHSTNKKDLSPSAVIFDVLCNLRRCMVPECIAYQLCMSQDWQLHNDCVADTKNGKRDPHNYVLRQIEKARDKAMWGEFEQQQAQSRAQGAAPVPASAPAPVVPLAPAPLSFIRAKEGAIFPIAHNVLAAVQQLGGTPAHDLLSDRMFVRGYPSEHMDDAVRHTLVESDLQFGARFKREMVRDVIEQAAKKNASNPVQDYLRALEWDGVPRLDTLTVDLFGAADTEAHRFMGRKWMISAAARALKPGCQVDYMLILEGEQGIKKSTALEALFGAEWTNTTHVSIDSKDALSSLRGKWLRVFEECDALSRKDAATVKAFLTARVDSYRPVYARTERDFPRQCVFAGTTNKENYLVDETGGRRFWAIRCGIIDVDAIRAMRDQLWAEAVHCYKSGEAWWPQDKSIESQLEAIQESRNEAVASPLHERISLMLEAQQGRVFTTTIMDALKEAGVVSNDASGRSLQMKLSPIMKRLGWQRSSNGNARYYFRGSHQHFLTVSDLKATMSASRNHLSAVPEQRAF